MKGKTNLKTFLITSLFLAVLPGICSPARADPIGWFITQLTDNSYDDQYPQTSGRKVVWYGWDGSDTEIFFWDGNTTQVTDNSYNDALPQISDSNVVWYGNDGSDYEIFFWDGNTIIQLTYNSYDDYNPQISGPKVVWAGWDGSGDTEIFLFSWDGNTTTQLTDNSYNDVYPQISGSNVVWHGWDGSDEEIFFWNGNTTQVTNNSYNDDDSQISGSNIVWEGFDGNDSEIFLWDPDPNSPTTQLTNNSYNDGYPQISGSNVVWRCFDGSDYEIFFWGDPCYAPTQVTNNSHHDRNPQISGSNIVWEGYDGSDYEIFFWDGTTTTQLTDNSYDDSNPQVLGSNVVWQGEQDGSDYEIFMATNVVIDYYVDDDAPNDPGPGDPNISDPCEDGSLNFPFDAIQEAIDAATDGNTICVLDGTYTGTGNRDVNFVGKAITVLGWNGPQNCVIDCNGITRGINFNSAEDGNSVLDGFTIMNGYAMYGAGIYCNGSSPTIRNCVIKDNGSEFGSAFRGGGIYCFGSSPKIINCAITNNIVYKGGPPPKLGGGLYCELSNPDIINCTISGNAARNGGNGIYCIDSDPTVFSSTIRDNNRSGDYRGIELSDANSTLQIAGIVHIISNDIVGNGNLQISPGGSLDLDNAHVFSNMSGPGTVTVALGVEATIDGNSVIDLGDPCDPNVKGTIDSEGFLTVKDKAKIINARINVTRAAFEDKAEIRKSEIHVDSKAPYGTSVFADPNTSFVDVNIYADGDRYMDLDPSVFDGNFVNIRIFVTITEGIGQPTGGLLECRGEDGLTDVNSCDPNNVFFCLANPGTIPDCNIKTWTLERLELIPGAKLNLTNRFPFQPPYDPGTDYDVVYVKELILRQGSVLNTSFNKIYYDSLIKEPNAVIRNEPLLGFSMTNIAMDDQTEFIVRVTHNNYTDYSDPNYNRVHVERVEGLPPDPNGMMRMRNLLDLDPNSPDYNDTINARAKGLFSKSSEDKILIRFEYLFEAANPSAELLISLSDVPELLDYNDPCRADHYIQVASLRPPPPGRYGSVGSDHFGLFEKTVSVGSLNFIRGVRMELELDGPVGTRMLINNWDPYVDCYYCGDVTGDEGVTTRDFLTVLGEYGRLTSGTDTYCLDAKFSDDGYVDTGDLMGWGWGEFLKTEGLIGNFCFSLCLTPCTKLGYLKFIPQGPSAPPPLKNGLTGLEGTLLIAGKRFVSNQEDFLSDRLYDFDEDCNLIGGPFANPNDRLNGKLARDYEGELYQLNLEYGLVRLSDNNSIIPREQSFPFNSEPRYNQSATIYVGFQGSGEGTWGRPVLDADFDFQGYVYVTPVVVDPEFNEPYIASAKLQLEPDCNVIEIFYEPPLLNDNQDPNNSCEIEVDEQGNVYIINSAHTNNSDILRVFGGNGNMISRCELQNIGIFAPIGLCCSRFDDSRLYLASSKNDPEASSTSLYVISKDDLIQYPNDPNFQIIDVNGMGHITDIAENPLNGTVWAVGFTMSKIPAVLPLSLSTMKQFYEPNLAEIPYGSTGQIQAVCLSDANDLALPLSIVWTGDKCVGADLDESGAVSFTDFAILADQWLQAPGSPSADIAPETPDGFVNMLDLAVLVRYWLETGCTP